ncbi:MAG: Lrp/AsnC family transcriptional regulator [Alysiella sp.]|uniref:Lrp/AsnC family transcriptional regulator n=1 Tax=Alysiella sp. TaxID=1872483 RepID=UPI0026DAAF08|nr:Lrp/AsnC family transcriptional regulator [Alysiella sp.]MDO4433429.1 Lrp/AsnC family transcriptional regulator [Alysiella sp.]
MGIHELDKLDRQILNILQEDATTPLVEIAEKVHSSPATCQRRIRQMHDNGVILKQVALVNPIAVGRSLSVFVAVSVESQNPALLDKFVRSLNNENDVVSCYEISGEHDYLLLIHAQDMAHYHQLTRRIFTSDNNVRAFKSQFVMDFNKVETKIVL